MDVLRDVERKDVTNVLEMHIFITQFFHKYDLRTTMLVRNPGEKSKRLLKTMQQLFTVVFFSTSARTTFNDSLDAVCSLT